jgi:catechol 2,3-dioxygenase-like lactoylglutathione lyase family enzyme
MRKLSRTIALVALGAALGSVLTASGAARQAGAPGVRMNHVGVSVKDFEESVRFYTQTLGFREAYRLRDANGIPTMSYIQISRETFLEVVPANANRPPGLSHVGIEADDIQAAVARLRQAGAQVQDPRFAANTGATLTNVADPQGIRVEFLQIGPGSMQRKAIDSWR